MIDLLILRLLSLDAETRASLLILLDQGVQPIHAVRMLGLLDG